MTPDYAVQLVREALMAAFWLAVPVLAVGFAAGVVISLLQILTSIQDTTFNTVPRLAAVLAALIVGDAMDAAESDGVYHDHRLETSQARYARWDPSLPLTTIFAFLVVLARVSGVFVFVPMPGFAGGPEPVRIAFFAGADRCCILYPLWPVLHATPGIGLLVGWLLTEAALGLTIGLLVGFLAEAFGLFGQMVSLHSGHSFASTIDPNTQVYRTQVLTLWSLGAIDGRAFCSSQRSGAVDRGSHSNFLSQSGDASAGDLPAFGGHGRWPDPHGRDDLLHGPAPRVSGHRVADDGGPRAGAGRKSQCASAAEFAGFPGEDAGHSRNSRAAPGSYGARLSGLRRPPAGSDTRADRRLELRAWRIKKQRNRHCNGA